MANVTGELLSLYKSPGGEIFWTGNITNSDLQIISNGPVIHAAVLEWLIWASNNNCRYGQTAVVLPVFTNRDTTLFLYTATVGAHAVTLYIRTDGKIAIRRSAGDLTYKIALRSMYI